MIIRPKIRGFICTTAHPVGCAEHVREQAEYAGRHPLPGAPKRVLVVGASTGYGLAARIAAAFGGGADTVGVFLERPAAGGRTATAGWYNNRAFEQLAAQAGHKAPSICADAFSDECKEQAVECIRREMQGGQVDLVVYSLAAPRRTDPAGGAVHHSVIKPIGAPFSGKTVDFQTGRLTQVRLEPATQEEIAGTLAVMGGEDWLLWMRALKEAGVLADGAATVAFSYIGPELTHAIYKDGTIGKAKEDLEDKAGQIDTLLAPLGGKAFVSVNKALVTQASSAIPVVPLYISMLYKIMKELGTHEGCIEQMVRLLDRLYAGGRWDAVPVDETGRIRLDDWEMRAEVQNKIAGLWDSLDEESFARHADLDGYRADFSRLFGFGIPGVDYDAPVADELV